MKIVETGFKDLLIIEPRIFEDARGYFFESYNQKNFEDLGIKYQWCQDNQAFSSYGVVRGLHYQVPPFTQTKLIRALQGRILDVVVDLRRKEPTYGQHFQIELSTENKKQLLVPAGFAHGYAVLSETAEVLYKCDQFYAKNAEGGLNPLDPALKIDWQIPVDKMILSEKDQLYPKLEQLDHPF